MALDPQDEKRELEEIKHRVSCAMMFSEHTHHPQDVRDILTLLGSLSPRADHPHPESMEFQVGQLVKEAAFRLNEIGRDSDSEFVDALRACAERLLKGQWPSLSPRAEERCHGGMDGDCKEPGALVKLIAAFEERSRWVHQLERDRTGTFAASHGYALGVVHDKWDDCPSHPCRSDRKLLASLQAQRDTKSRSGDKPVD